jgi:hypothetical protein
MSWAIAFRAHLPESPRLASQAASRPVFARGLPCSKPNRFCAIRVRTENPRTAPLRPTEFIAADAMDPWTGGREAVRIEMNEALVSGPLCLRFSRSELLTNRQCAQRSGISPHKS